MNTSAESPQESANSRINAHMLKEIWLNVSSSGYFSHAVFSFKTFIAGILALYVAFLLDLSQPSWSIVTVYIVAQPLSGMLLSKALSRILGTFIGAVMSVFIVAAFSGVPEIFIFIIALWIGICLYVSVYLRDIPASYGAMLSGYTAAIIGFQVALAPNTVFDTAVARCLEIVLGISCATVANLLFFPKSTGELFRTAIRHCVNDYGNWIVDTLQEKRDDAKGLADLRKLIADTTALESLRMHAVYDSPEVRASDKTIRTLQAKLMTMSSILVSIHDRLALLREKRPRIKEALNPLLNDIAARIETSNREQLPVTHADATVIENEIIKLRPSFDSMRNDPGSIVECSIIARLSDLFRTWQETMRLKSAVLSGAHTDDPAPPPETAQYRDHTLAAVASAVTIVTIIVACVLWIATGWSYGSSMTSFAGIITCIAATQDNPLRIAGIFFKASFISALLATAYILVVLPSIDSFPLLTAALAIVILPLGMLIPNPRFSWSRTLCIHFIMLISLHNAARTHFVDFLNTTIALQSGILIGAVMLAILRPIGSGWALLRLKSGMMKDLARLASAKSPMSRHLFESLMIDRINSVRLRLDPNNAEDRRKLEGSLATLRVGLNILALRHTITTMPDPLQAKIHAALDLLGQHCQQSARKPENATGFNPINPLMEAEQALLTSGPGSHEESTRSLLAIRNIHTTMIQHPRFFGLAYY